MTDATANTTVAAEASPVAMASVPEFTSVAQRQGASLAPSPIQDKFPVVIGQNLSLAYLSSVFRLCTSGLRYAFVDALSELLEHDPHARGVTRQRVLQVAASRIEIVAAKLPPDDPDADRAKEIADEVSRQIENIPALAQSIGALAWGIIQGLSALEVYWNRTADGRWEVARLGFIHSRRLSFTDPRTTDVYVWDQGAVNGEMLSTAQYGLRIASFPGKFIVHSPQLSGEYAWRDGEGRYIAFYMALKRMVVRATAQDFERTIRPWVVGYFSRDDNNERPTPASKEDIDKLDAAIKALANGTFNGAAFPDSCKVELLRAASTLDAQKFVEWLDAQVSKAILGQTYTSEPGKTGARSASETAQRGTITLGKYDANCIADTLERDLLRWIVKYNFPGAEARLCPRARVHITEDPDEVLARVQKATSVDIPVNVELLEPRIGLPILAKDDTESRRTRMVGPGKGPTPEDPDDVQPNQEKDRAIADKNEADAKETTTPSDKTDTRDEPAKAQ